MVEAIRKDLYKEEYEFPIKCDLKYTLNDVIDKKVCDDYKSTEIALKNINKYLESFKNSNRYKGKENYIIANEIRASKCNLYNI